jgi:hypothetical protein
MKEKYFSWHAMLLFISWLIRQFGESIGKLPDSNMRAVLTSQLILQLERVLK